jgi:ribosomal protein S18 acetylase RimI-like enzyme
MKTESPPLFRRATEADLPAIIAMLADDELGSAREDISEAGRAPYLEAFRALERDPNHFLLVMELDGELVGNCQLSFIPGLSSRGAMRGQIESVRVASSRRGQGLGEMMIRFALETFAAKGCRSAQLTSSKSRTKAIRFYERIGFKVSHEGMKISL